MKIVNIAEVSSLEFLLIVVSHIFIVVIFIIASSLMKIIAN